MHTPRCILPRLLYEKISEAADMVEKHLSPGWSIRIEYTETVKYQNTQWEQWGGAFYNESNFKKIIGGIYACHIQKPECALRISAEKYSPATRFYFMICDSKNASEAHVSSSARKTVNS